MLHLNLELKQHEDSPFLLLRNQEPKMKIYRRKIKMTATPILHFPLIFSVSYTVVLFVLLFLISISIFFFFCIQVIALVIHQMFLFVFQIILRRGVFMDYIFSTLIQTEDAVLDMAALQEKLSSQAASQVLLVNIAMLV